MVDPILTADDIDVLRGDAGTTHTTTCRVEDPTGNSAQDPVTGLEEPTYETAFTSLCAVRGPSATTHEPVAQTVEIGGIRRTVIKAGIELPVTDDELKPKQRIVITTLGPRDDPALLGKKFIIVGFTGTSNEVVRPVDVVEV